MKWKRFINLHVSWLLWDREDSNVAMFSTGWGDGLQFTLVMTVKI